MRPSPRLLDQLHDRIRVKHYSIRTETAYVDWARRFVLFHGERHPRELAAAEVEAYLRRARRFGLHAEPGEGGAALSLPRCCSRRCPGSQGWWPPRPPGACRWC